MGISGSLPLKSATLSSRRARPGGARGLCVSSIRRHYIGWNNLRDHVRHCWEDNGDHFARSANVPCCRTLSLLRTERRGAIFVKFYVIAKCIIHQKYNRSISSAESPLYNLNKA